MNPTLKTVSEENDIYKFTLSNINVSLANALRRTILSDIETLVFYTETYEDNKCNIEVNTSRLHNEIIKQRLSCIPIHMKSLDLLPDKYILEVNVSNNTDNVIYVTTEDFKIRNKTNNNYLTNNETRSIFPPNNKTQSYIDFVRLRPKISDYIPGEQLSLTCEFSISSAGVNSMFNVVSICTYGNTPDLPGIEDAWGKQEAQLLANDLSREEIDFQKRNFYILDSQRIFIPDSFDFIIQTIGIFENKEIVYKACILLHNKFVDIIENIQSDTVPIMTSSTTIDNCFDIVLENEDYTVGKVIEYILYNTYYKEQKTLTYCGFKKFHPHNTESIIRIAFVDPVDKTVVRDYIQNVCIEAGNIFQTLSKQFSR